jgi:hypothetical protein
VLPYQRLGRGRPGAVSDDARARSLRRYRAVLAVEPEAGFARERLRALALRVAQEA